ncbi:MAG: metal ABC transporter permease, partial [Lancefieldella rimae]
MPEIEILKYAFMQRALVTGLATALVCGLLSCWITHMGWSLMGDAISHSILPGVVISHLVGLPYLVGALVFALITVILVGQVKKSQIVKPDTAIGIVFTTFFALGTVLISKVPSQINLSHILFGNLLGVTVPDMLQVLLIGLPIALVLVLKNRDLTLLAFDPTHAQAIGLSVRWLTSLLLIALALAIVISLQAVGVILS